VLKYKHSKLLTEKKIVSDAMLSKENILHNQEKFIEESVNNITKRTTTFSQDI
jgi:3-methyladenine DNA glycosylase AlkC